MRLRDISFRTSNTDFDGCWSSKELTPNICDLLRNLTAKYMNVKQEHTLEHTDTWQATWFAYLCFTMSYEMLVFLELGTIKAPFILSEIIRNSML
jgi:hypothetical protein